MFDSIQRKTLLIPPTRFHCCGSDENAQMTGKNRRQLASLPSLRICRFVYVFADFSAPFRLLAQHEFRLLLRQHTCWLNDDNFASLSCSSLYALPTLRPCQRQHKHNIPTAPDTEKSRATTQRYKESCDQHAN